MKDTFSRRKRLKRKKEKEPCKRFTKDQQNHESHIMSGNGTYALHNAGKINLWITPYNTLEISLLPS